MFTLVVIILILVIVLIAFALDEPLPPPLDAERAESPTKDVSNQLRQSFDRLTQDLTQRITRLTAHEHPLKEPFMAWIADNLHDNPELQTWLLSLNDATKVELTYKIEQLFDDLTLELEWLLDGEFADHPELEQMSVEVINHYCQAFWIAFQELASIQNFFESRDDLKGDLDLTENDEQPTHNRQAQA